MPETQDSPRRREVLEFVRAAGDAPGAAEVAEHLGVHPNTARFHLDALVADGRIEQRVEQPSGPGRPRTVYVPHAGMDRGGSRGYRLLARMLLSNLTSQDADAGRAAMETGRTWGRFLSQAPSPGQHLTADQAARRLTALLDDLGFAPTPASPAPDGTPTLLRLYHCPFLELAEEYGQVVCPLHLGLMQGALAELAAPLAATALEPFAEPDACHARLTPTPAHAPA